MWRNYLITAGRMLARNKLYSAINVLGLAIGLAACILVLLFVRDELSFDQSWPQPERIFRIQTHFEIPGVPPLTSVAAAGPVKDVLGRNIGDIDAIARFNQLRPTIRDGQRVFVEQVAYIDPEFLSIFGITPIRGEIEMLSGDSTALIATESFAAKYFGTGEALGKVLTLTIFDSVRDYRVTAIVPDPPDNSHLTYNAFVFADENEFLQQPWMFKSWLSVNHLTYLRLKDGVPPVAVSARFDKLVDENFTEWPTGPELMPSDLIELSMINVRDIHLQAKGQGEVKPSGDIRIIYTFSAIALLILLIANINFVNLTTAKSTQRAREVSVRKVMGASRSQLIAQFLGESLLLSFAGLVIALALAEAALPWFNDFVGRNLQLQLLSSATSIGAFAGLAVFVGIIGGMYPALYLSRFRPAAALNGNAAGNQAADGTRAASLRQALVIVQFAISAGLLAVTAVVYSQMNFLGSTNLQFDRERLLLVDNLGRDAVAPYADVLKAEILKVPGVTDVSLSSTAPASEFQVTAPVRIKGQIQLEPPMIGYRIVDEDFFRTYGIDLLEGRDFDRARSTDMLPRDLKDLSPEARNGAVIMNLTAVRRLGLGSADEAIGKTLLSAIGGVDDAPSTVTLQIVGVVPDVHFSTLKRNIEPEMYIFAEDGHRVMAVRYERAAVPSGVALALESVWRGLIGDVPFSYSHLSDVLAQQYEQESLQATLLGIFAVLAAVVASLGLYGLAAFTAERRTKEIGIRKILGARVFDIVRLMVGQFSAPVVLANVIAWPVAWYVLRDWLAVFAYRIDLTSTGPAIFVAVGIVSLLLAWLTVGGYALKVARTNPVEAIRSPD